MTSYETLYRLPEAPRAVATGEMHYPEDTPVATRAAYGNALKRLYPRYPDVVCLDGEAVITVEDHYAQGGLGEAVAAALPGAIVHILAVRKKPRSGTPQELLDDQGISRTGIIHKVKEIVR